ncbi:MAG: orotate phosphoribosyltransferase [Candidatus Marisimplicoccus sp.]
MVFDKIIAKKTINYLLQINAIKLNTKNPFTWASGIKSPIYCDNRLILSNTEVRSYIANQMSNIITKSFSGNYIVAGVATGAIAIGALVAERLKTPYIYVRPNPKGHGLKNQIEGSLRVGSNVIVIEDLISTGMSSLNAVNAIKSENSNVKGMLSIFSYSFDFAIERFKSEKIDLISLADYNILIEIVKEEKIINEDEIKKLERWRENPEDWL